MRVVSCLSLSAFCAALVVTGCTGAEFVADTSAEGAVTGSQPDDSASKEGSEDPASVPPNESSPDESQSEPGAVEPNDPADGAEGDPPDPEASDPVDDPPDPANTAPEPTTPKPDPTMVEPPPPAEPTAQDLLEAQVAKVASMARLVLETLTDSERARATFSLADERRTDWAGNERAEREGVELDQLIARRVTVVLSLFSHVLSEIGLQRVKAIMALEGDPDIERDYLPYYFAFYGEPGAEEGWGFGLEGHHLSLNFTFVGMRAVSVTPMFLGAEPATSGASAGMASGPILAPERAALQLTETFNEDLWEDAWLESNVPEQVKSHATVEASRVFEDGLSGSKLGAEQLELVRSIAQFYLENINENLAAPRKKAFSNLQKSALEFVWTGEDRLNQLHYFSVQTEGVLAEFTRKEPNHVHSVWREFKGDFGRNILP